MQRAAYLLILLFWPLLAAGQLPLPVLNALNQHRLDPAGLSVWVQALDADTPLLAHHAEVPRNPASAIKLLTTYAGLELLGPQYTWRTEAYPVGRLQDGVLHGDLVLKGYGDPFLTPEAFWTVLRGLRDRGLREITGDLVLDRSFFAPISVDPGAFDGQADRAYNAIPDALLVNFQAIQFSLRPANGAVQVIASPNPANLQINNRLQLIGGACQLDHLNFSVTNLAVNFSGRYPSACGETALLRTVLPAEQLAYGVFRDLWQGMGGGLSGSLRQGQINHQTAPLFTRHSPTLAEVIRGMNKFSNNVMTRQLLLTLGAELDGTPGTEAKGQAVIDRWLRQQGLVMPELVVDNGAGLSRDTRISAQNMGRLLHHAAHSRFFPELQASMPLLGIDGTVSRRFRNHALTGQARLKTGTLRDVRSVAGYMRTANGRDYVVVMLHNGPGVQWGVGTEVQNALLEWLYNAM